MAGWRDHKRQMRRGVHQVMCVPALYIHASGATPWPLTIRGPHNKRPISVGELPGSDGWAEREDAQPRLIFMRSELPEGFRVNAIISVEVGEAYRLGVMLKPDDIVQAVEVVQLDATEAAGLPVPASDQVPASPASPHPGVYQPGHTHTQTVAAATWTVTHNLGVRPVVAVTLANGEEVEALVTHVSDNQFTVAFDQPETGEARYV